jgi:hypothetical protein
MLSLLRRFFYTHKFNPSPEQDTGTLTWRQSDRCPSKIANGIEEGIDEEITALLARTKTLL